MAGSEQVTFSFFLELRRSWRKFNRCEFLVSLCPVCNMTTLVHVIAWRQLLRNTSRPTQMASIFHTAYSNAFSSMKMHRLRLKYHWMLVPLVELTISQHWLRWWLEAGQATSHYLNQWWLVYWRIDALTKICNPIWCDQATVLTELNILM